MKYLDWPVQRSTSRKEVHRSPNSSLSHGTRRSRWRGFVPGAGWRILGFLREAWAFRRALRSYRPDLLFVNVNGSEATALGARLAGGFPVVTCYHLSVTRPEGSLLDQTADRLLKVASMWAGRLAIHTSRAVRAQWCKLCFFPRRRTRVVYNGVDDLPATKGAEKRAEMGLGPEDFVFCVPGRLHPIKGHSHLLDALSPAGPLAGARVLFCGDGDLRESLERQAAERGVSHLVRFLGWRTDLPAVLRASDCTVLPSVASENLSIAVLESLMTGTPAIVTQVGGMPEAVKDGVSGLVVPPASPTALRKAMLAVMADRPWCQRLGERARRDVLERFTRDRMKAEYVRTFSDLLGGQETARQRVIANSIGGA